LLCQITFAQQVVIDQEITAPFLSVVKDLRGFNICIEESLGSDGIIVTKDNTLSPRYIAIADGAFLDDIILIRYNDNLLSMPFEEQKFVLLHEIAHHAGLFHWNRVLAMQSYYVDIPYYKKKNIKKISILLAD